MGIADDYMYLKLSNVTNNGNKSNLEYVIINNQFNPYHYSPFATNYEQQGNRTINLLSGYYYLEGFCLNGPILGYCKTIVDMPKFTN